jgi:hypothetical protein
MNEVRSNAKKNISLFARFADALEIEMLEISYTSVDNLEMITRGRFTEISPFDEDYGQTSQRSVPSGRNPEDPSTYNDEVVFFFS